MCVGGIGRQRERERESVCRGDRKAERERECVWMDRKA